MGYVPILADLSFSQELLVAVLSGGIAALGGGAAVYTGLARSQQKRDVRNQFLDDFVTADLVRVTSIAAEVARRIDEGKWTGNANAAELSEIMGHLTSKCGNGAAFLDRGSRWDHRKMMSAFLEIVESGTEQDLPAMAVGIRNMRRYVNRRLRSPFFSIGNLWTWITDRKVTTDLLGGFYTDAKDSTLDRQLIGAVTEARSQRART